MYAWTYFLMFYCPGLDDDDFAWEAQQMKKASGFVGKVNLFSNIKILMKSLWGCLGTRFFYELMVLKKMYLILLPLVIPNSRCFRRLRWRLLSEILFAIFQPDIFGRFQALTKYLQKKPDLYNWLKNDCILSTVLQIFLLEYAWKRPRISGWNIANKILKERFVKL